MDHGTNPWRRCGRRQTTHIEGASACGCINDRWQRASTLPSPLRCIHALRCTAPAGRCCVCPRAPFGSFSSVALVPGAVHCHGFPLSSVVAAASPARCSFAGRSSTGSQSCAEEPSLTLRFLCRFAVLPIHRSPPAARILPRTRPAAFTTLPRRPLFVTGD